MSKKERTTKVEVIKPHIPETTVNITIGEITVTLTESEAKKFANDLCDQLGIRPIDHGENLRKMFEDEVKKRPRAPKNPWPRNPYEPLPEYPKDPYWMPPLYKIWC